MELHIWLRRMKNMALLMALTMLFLADAKVNAAEKETPLVNLARGRTTIVDSRGNQLTDPHLLTDEDKYYLQHNTTDNKIPGSQNYESYVERGAKMANGGEWIQLDLGASYPLEVINLKRRMYTGTTQNNSTRLQYNSTVIVIGNKKDLSDGYVVHYNGGDVQLPTGVEKPANATAVTYAETMGGAWFYMDNTRQNGTGYTDLGTTRTARYIRVYSDNPDTNDNLMLMELAVYGYRTADKIQSYRKRKVINNEHPLMIAAAYSNDTYSIGQDEPVGLQGYNTITGRWAAIPADLKDNSVLMMHSNNLRSGAPAHIGQAVLQAYSEACLKEAYQTNVSVMLMLNNASSVPGGANWCITRDLDYHWLDLIFRMYPNMEGTFCTENFWSGSHEAVAKGAATTLEIAHRHGGYQVYSEADHNNIYDNIMGNADFKAAVEKYGESMFFTYKNTQGSKDGLHSQSALIGSWLAGYIGGWGMLSDTWAWGNSGMGPLWHTGGGYVKNWKAICTQPEAIFGMQMLTTYLNGGVVYTFEFPEVVYGAVDTNSPAFTHMVERVFRYICQNPAPDRGEVLNRTKVILYGDVTSNIYNVTTGSDNAMAIVGNGRYGAVPSIPNWGTKEEVTQKLKETAKREGASAPVVIANNDALVGYGAKQYFNSMYPINYLGDTFADKYNGSWYFYNSSINTNVKQTATVALESAQGTARFTTVLEPHAFFVMKEEADSSIHISLNNYRVDKQQLIYDNRDWDWSGSSATGQGVSPGKRSVYRYMAYYNVVNAQRGVEDIESPGTTIDQLSPADNDLRTSTFKISSLTAAPSVKIVAGQAPDTDNKQQYNQPQVHYDSSTKTATITIESNGWVELKITDLNYETNANAVKIEEPTEQEYGERENLAARRPVTASHEPSGVNDGGARPLTWITDGDKGADKYSNPGKSTGGPIWIQVDLGGLHKVEEVKLYRYWQDSRKYNNTVVMLSPDSNFSADSTLVLWNGNGADGGRNGSTVDSWPGNGNGAIGTHTLPTGTDASYSESQNGKSFKVYSGSDNQVSWLGTSSAQLPTNEEENNRFQARYVRIYMNGHTRTNGQSFAENHIIELEVFGERNLKEQANYTNLGRNSSITVSSAGTRGNAIAVDGNKSSADSYMDPGGNAGGAQWVQLDLGIEHNVEKVVLYRYWADRRSYYNTVVMLSTDFDFSPENTLVLWNGNGVNGGRDSSAVDSWPGNGNGNTVRHTLPQGTDAAYQETNAGKTFNVYDSTVRWLDPNKQDPVPSNTSGSNRFKARYVRIYMNGSTVNTSNHIVEIEVFGEAGKFVLDDKTAPEKVTGIEATRIRAKTATIGFLPSMDDLGLRGYKMSIKKAGEAQGREIMLNQTSYELTGLTPNTQYEVTITAIDNFDNSSEISDTYTFTSRSEGDYTVIADKQSGKYDAAQEITLSTALGAGEIYYTTDGTKPFDQSGNPTQTAVQYNPGTSIGIAQSCVLQAALKADGEVWATSSFFFRIGEEPLMDLDVPKAPTAVTVSNLSATGATISWSSSSPDVKAFYIYIDGVKKTEVSMTQTTMEVTFTDLDPLTAYQIWITAVDGAGNESLRSKTIELITCWQ